MNFHDFLINIVNKALLTEAQGIGLSDRKERAKSATGDAKARDAARKRAERARETPREKKPSQELIKDVILVKTRGGNVQLIFKDSFNSSYHQKLNKQEMTIEEAKRATQESNFEQTRASKLLFGDVKTKETAGEEKGKKKAEATEREEARPKTAEEREKSEKTKARKLTREQMFQTMTQMTPEQLMQMPPEIRNEYFQMMRKATPSNTFDQMTYENLSVAFGLSDLSGVPYNQQVLNALVFLAKIKSGASDQEMQTYLALAPAGKEFTRTAFFTAKKILSQIGDQCLQTLLTNAETTGQPVNSEGYGDMECGNYRFKISAGGEVSFSSTDFNQSNKNFKGFIANSLSQALMNPQVISSDPKLSAAFERMGESKSQFSKLLIPDEMLAQIKNNPDLAKQLQSMKISDSNGNDLGTVLDAEGNLNPMASLGNYRKTLEDGAYDIMKGGKDSGLKKFTSNFLLKTMLRGDGIVDPDRSANHLITVNGIFPMTDDYFAEISQNATLGVTKAKDVMTSSNIVKFKPSAAERLKKFTALVEEKEKSEKKLSAKDLLVDIDEIDPIQMMVNYIVKNNDFSLNASLLPGFKPGDLNAVQYNYVTVGDKTTKIPVMKDDNITNQILGEELLILNDLILEALTNNFVLAELVNNNLISRTEADWMNRSNDLLIENSEYVIINLKSIFDNAKQRLMENPELILQIAKEYVEEAYKRNYKQEYKNYHGKPKQRKERAERTKAREEMIKKGRVKKGDGKDIDHKKALRHGGSNGINNLRVRDRSENRADNGHHKGETQDKDWK